MASAADQLPTPSNDTPADQVTPDQGGQESGVELRPAINRIERDEDNGDRGEVANWKDDKRAEIFARARENKRDTQYQYSGSPADPNALYGVVSDKSELGALELEAVRRQQERARQELEDVTGEPAPSIPSPPQQQPGKPRSRAVNDLDPDFLAQPIRAIVDGQERYITVEEAVRNYQMNSAADLRLASAQAILQQAKEFQRLASTSRPNSGYSGEEQDTDQSGNGRRQPASANARDMIEKIQLGSTEEALDAFQSLIDMQVQKPAPAGIDEATVLNVLENRTSKEAITQYAQENPEIVNDPIINDMLPKFSHREMAEDLLRTGLTMDQMRQYVQTPQDLAAMHREARSKRAPGVRSVSQIMAAAHQRIQTWRNGGVQPAQQQNQQRATMQDRQQRKASLPNQPTGRKLAPQSQQQNATQDQSRQSAVTRMRQARGQAT
jgi:hypothetical protein